MLDHSQLPLDIHLRDDATFSSFYPGDNLQAKLAAQKWADKKGETFIYMWGGHGVGKSHLLHAACHEAFEAGLPAVYIPLKKVAKLSAQMLEDLEKVSLVCLDDIHCVSGNAVWEEALFHFYNRIRDQKKESQGHGQGQGQEQSQVQLKNQSQDQSFQLQEQGQCRLMVSAETSPLQIPLQLADLKSRLASGVTYQLQMMTDEQKLEALRLRAHCRGLELNKSVAQFLLSRCPRNMQELFETLEKLDHASLAEQRRLTIPFVKQILNI